MRSTLVREIEKTIRALEEFVIDWEKQFPENERKGSRTRARTPRRRLAQILEMPSLAVAARETNPIRHGIGNWRVGRREECGEQAVGGAVNKWRTTRA